MARSVWKGPYVDASLLRKVRKYLAKNDKGMIKTYSRRSCIIPDFVGLIFGVYNGKVFVPVEVTEAKVGRKLGEFSPTRIFRSHSGDKKAGR